MLFYEKDPPKLFGTNAKSANFMYMIHREINMIDLNILLKNRPKSKFLIVMVKIVLIIIIKGLAENLLKL